MKKSNIVLTSVVAAALMVTSCSTASGTPESVQSAMPEQTNAVIESGAAQSAPAASSDATVADQTTAASAGDANDGDFFATHTGTYFMSSGAGAWNASLTVNEDGTFMYDMHDSDMDHVYVCTAHGSLTNVTKVDDFTYTFVVQGLTYDYEPGSTWVDESLNFEAVESDTVTEGCELTFYEAGISTASLPENYVLWYTMPRALQESDVPAEFPCAGIYNASAERGFMFEY